MSVRMALVSLMVVLSSACVTHGEQISPKSWMTTPTPRPGDWVKRHEGFVQLAHQGGIDVLFIGDSITDGWRNTGLATWKKYFAPLKAANFGIAGDGTQNVLWRLQNGELDLPQQPKAVVFLLGTNNIPSNFQHDDMQETARMVAEADQLLIQTIHAKLPQTKVLLLAIFPRGEGPNPGRDCIKLVNEKLAKLESERVRFLDIGSIFLDGTHIPHELMSDFLHPTGKGYERWAPAMLPVLKALLLTR